jgi:hypothetical protein
MEFELERTMTREAEYHYQHPDYGPERLSISGALSGLALWAAGLLGLVALFMA